MIQQPKVDFPVDPYQRLNSPIRMPLPQADAPVPLQGLLRSSVRSQRKWVVMATVALTLGVLVLALYSPARDSFLSPGPLAASHAQIIKSQGHERCATCHGPHATNLPELIQNAFADAEPNAQSQSHLCLACHVKSLGKQFALSPHNSDPKSLQKITDEKLAKFKGDLQISTDVFEREISCATCHREHHGRQFDLTNISDRKCQICHVQTFDHFENSHPDFQLASSPVPDRFIRFDHFSHAGKHFSEKGKSFECRDCHVSHDQGATFEVASFEIGCGECHIKPIQSSLQAGVEIFNWPTMDVVTLEKAGYAVNGWPANAQGDFDGALTPITQLLLSSDSQVAEILEKGNGNIDFFSLSKEKIDDIKEAGAIAQALLRLSNEINLQGKEAIRNRLKKATGLPVSDDELDSLFYGLADDAFKQFSDATSTQSLPEVSSTKIDASDFLDQELFMIRRGETIAAERLSPVIGKPGIAYAENSTQTDLANNLNPSSQTQQSAQENVTQVLSAGRLNSDDNSNRTTTTKQKTLPSKSDDGLLAKNPLSGLPSKPAKNGLLGNLESKRETNASPSSIVVQRPEKLPANRPFGIERQPINPSSLRSTVRYVPGSWNRVGPFKPIKYSPQSHADPVVKSWFELAIRAASSRPNAVTKNLLGQFTGSDGIGLCASCHQPRFKTGSSAIQWDSKSDLEFRKSFTNFSHRPHLLLRECNDCHRVADSIDGDQRAMVGDLLDFKPITKAQCASCHRAGQAPSHCSHCHQYHVGDYLSRELDGTNRRIPKTFEGQPAK